MTPRRKGRHFRLRSKRLSRCQRQQIEYGRDAKRWNEYRAKKLATIAVEPSNG